jgi:hypothetical protein
MSESGVSLTRAQAAASDTSLGDSGSIFDTPEAIQLIS